MRILKGFSGSHLSSSDSVKLHCRTSRDTRKPSLDQDIVPDTMGDSLDNDERLGYGLDYYKLIG